MNILSRDIIEELYNKYYINNISKAEAARQLKISRHTIRTYFKYFEEGLYESLLQDLRPKVRKTYSYTDEEFKKAVKESLSIRQVFSKLNLVLDGGANYQTFHKKVKELNVDTSHFTGKNLTGRKLPQRRLPIEEYLKKDTPTSSHKLKKYLIDAKKFEHKCYKCNLKEWNNLIIPLELEHINGDHNDNRLENLTLLCPNCHAQTDTYRGRNIKTKKPRIKSEVTDSIKSSKVQKTEQEAIEKLTHTCLSCSSKFKPNSGSPNKYCSIICSHKAQQKIEWTKDLVENLLISYKGNIVQASKSIGVSDNGLRKWCKKYNLNPKDYK